MLDPKKLTIVEHMKMMPGQTTPKWNDPSWWLSNLRVHKKMDLVPKTSGESWPQKFVPNVPLVNMKNSRVFTIITAG